MDGQGGTDQMIGGIGNDSYVINAISDVAAENANEGIDTVYAEIDYTLSGNLEQLILREGTAAVNGAGDNGDNVIIGNSAANLIYGNDGADTSTASRVPTRCWGTLATTSSTAVRAATSSSAAPVPTYSSSSPATASTRSTTSATPRAIRS